MTNAKRVRILLSFILIALIVFSQMLTVLADILSIQSSITSVSGTGTALKATVTGNNINELENTAVEYSVYKDGTVATNMPYTAVGGSIQTVSAGVYQRTFDVSINKADYTAVGNYTAAAQAVYGNTTLTSNSENIFGIQNANLLNFNITDSVINSSKPVIYFTDKAAKKLYSYNYETSALASLSFDLSPESLTFANNEVYVSLLKAEHNSYMNATDERGAVAFVDPDTLTLKDTMDVAIDPFDIAVDNNGYIYISSGSSQSTNLKSFSRATKQEMDSSEIIEKSTISLHPVFNRIYSDYNCLDRDIYAYNINNGQFTDNSGGYNIPNLDNIPIGEKMKISPDGAYIFNGAGTVFTAGYSKFDDMKYVYTLNSSYIDIDFNLANNRFYTVTKDNILCEYDYSNFKQVGTYSLPGVPKLIYSCNDKLVVIVTKSDGKSYVEVIPTTSISPVSNVTGEQVIKLDGVIADTFYDSRKNKIYAVDQAFNNLFVVDGATKAVNKVKLQYRPTSVTLSEDGTKIYIVNDDETNFITEVDSNTYAVTRNLIYTTPVQIPRFSSHQHVYQRNGKLYVIKNDTNLTLAIFDVNTFTELNYIVNNGTTSMLVLNKIGDISFSDDGKYLYLWSQDAPFGIGDSFVTKYSIDNNIFTKVDISTLRLPDINYSPYNTPLMLLENDRSIIYKKKSFNMDNLSQVKGTFPEEIYAVDYQKKVAYGKKKSYGLNDYLEKGDMPVQNADKLFLSTDGNLFMVKNKDAQLFYINPSEKEIKSFTVNGATEQSVIDNVYGSVNFKVPYNTDVRSLQPVITVSGGASITPLSVTMQDFTNPVNYTVTALDGTTKTWVASCSVETAPPVPVVMRKISGKVNLGPGVAPAGGTTVSLSVYSSFAGKPITSAIVVIPEGMNSIEYSINVPQGKYYLYYSVNKSSGYLSGWNFIENSTDYFYTNISYPQINADDNDAPNTNIMVRKNRKITGTLYLPNNEVVPKGGAYVDVRYYESPIDKTFTIYIPEGVNSQDFSFELPNYTSVKLYYTIYAYNAANLLTKYENYGFYSVLGTLGAAKRFETTLINLYDADYIGADMTLIPIGNTGPINPATTKDPDVPSDTGDTGTSTETDTGGSTNTSQIVNVGNDGIVTANPVLNSSTSTAVVTITSDIIDSALKSAAQSTHGSKSISIELEKVEGAGSYSVELQSDAISALHGNTVINIETELATVAVPVSSLSSGGAAPAGAITVTVGEANSAQLSDEAKKLLLDKPVIDLSIQVGDKEISTLDKRITVSIPYQPKTEELNKVEHLVIQYVDSNGKLVTIPNGKYNKETGTVEFRTDKPGNYGVGFIVKTFTDIKNYGWAQKEVEVLSSKGIINGVSKDNFNPESNITRADFIMLLVNALDLKAEADSNFSDVKATDYYYNALGTAKKLGLVLGSGENESRPGDKLTRQDMMVLVSWALQISGKKVQNGALGEISNYTDSSSVSSYAANDIAAMTKEGIIKGDGSKLKPLDNATRAEAAVIIYRVYNK